MPDPLEALALETQTQAEVIATLRKMQCGDTRSRVLHRIAEALPKAVQPSSTPALPATPSKGSWHKKVRTEAKVKAPWSKVVSETVAFAMKQGFLDNKSLASFKGIEPTSAEQRIQACLDALRIERTDRGQYQACAKEYERLGFPPGQQGKPMKLKVQDLVDLMDADRLKDHDPTRSSSTDDN